MANDDLSSLEIISVDEKGTERMRYPNEKGEIPLYGDECCLRIVRIDAWDEYINES